MENIHGMFASVIIEQMNVLGAEWRAAIWGYILLHLMPSDVANGMVNPNPTRDYPRRRIV
jgi:hypothetical protein